jgi:hypothetical protein
MKKRRWRRVNDKFIFYAEPVKKTNPVYPLSAKKIMQDNYRPLCRYMMMDITRPLTDSVTKKIAPLHGSKETLP